MLNSNPGELVNFACLGLDFAFQARRHFSQNFAIDLDAGLLHAREHRNQRQIDLFVHLQKLGCFDFMAQGSGKSSSDVGRFRQRAAQLQIEAAQRHFRQAMRRVRGIEQVGVQHGIMHALRAA